MVFSRRTIGFDRRAFAGPSLLSCILFAAALTAFAAADRPALAQAAEQNAARRTKPGLTVRVKASSGVPRLLVNGKPVRPRFFWGAPGSGLIRLTEQEQRLHFDFAPTQSEPATATMHFRFGQTAGDVYLDDIRVTDLDTKRDVVLPSTFEAGEADFNRDWNVWPPSPQNTVGKLSFEAGAGSNGSTGLHVHLSSPPNNNWPDFHIHHNSNLALIAGHHYRVTFWAKANPARDLTIAFYRPGTTYAYLGGPPGHFESQIRLAANAGVDLVSFETPLAWPAPGEPENWQAVDSVCETVLRANPRALMLLRVGLYVPDWWKTAHPDDMMRWEDGAHQGVASPASAVYRRDTSERLALLIRHVEAKFGAHVAGYHPTGQNTGEWFYMDSWERPLNGYAPCDVEAFRAWLRGRYRDETALRTAWNDPGVTVETAAVPTPAARHAAPAGVFRDPKTEQAIVDFVLFQQESMADCVRGFARVARRASEGKKLVVFFYGYGFEFGALPTGPGSSGHYAMCHVLGSPDIDILCSPISYFDRGPGESSPAMSAAESVVLAGKMWLNEDDTRTYLTRESAFPGSEHIVHSLAETNGELSRNVAQEALRGFGTWWMDLPGTGWFDDPGIWAEMVRLRRLDEPMLRTVRRFRPQVAVVLSEPSMAHVADGGDVAVRPAVYEARAALGRMGAPYGQYLLDDVASGKVHAKLYVFVNAWRLTSAERERLRRATKGSVCVWCYAPGLFDDERESQSAMRELTGFVLERVTPEKAWATPAEIGRKRGVVLPFGVPGAIRPLFAATDAEPNEILATYPDGSTAVALRRTSEGVSLFVGAPGLTPDLLRFAARAAGVHLYTTTDCNVYANGPYIALHAAHDGRIEVDAGAKGPVFDLLTGERVGMGPKVRLDLKRGQTRILKAGGAH